MCIRENENKKLYEQIQNRNLLRQYDLLLDCIDIGLEKVRIEASFDKYVLWSLNQAAVANLQQFGGRFRECPVFVGKHIPPKHEDVAHEIDKMISFVHLEWNKYPEYPNFLSAYVLWRLNWIHPFMDGNGRTARAVCYYLMCLRAGRLLPGVISVPELIRENREPYYKALVNSDRAWANGKIEVSDLMTYLDNLEARQIKSAQKSLF